MQCVDNRYLAENCARRDPDILPPSFVPVATSMFTIKPDLYLGKLNQALVYAIWVIDSAKRYTEDDVRNQPNI